MRSAWLAWPLSSSFRFLLCGSASVLCDMLAGPAGGRGSGRAGGLRLCMRVCARGRVLELHPGCPLF